MRAWISMDKSVGGTQYSAERMITGYKYYFRVAGINATGTGVFCATSDCFLISDPIGMPDPPMHVKITDITASSVSLKWKEPEFTGNLPITTYQIETLKSTMSPEDYFAKEKSANSKARVTAISLKPSCWKASAASHSSTSFSA